MLTIESGVEGLLHVYADGQLTTEDYVDFVTRFDWFISDGSSPVAMRVELGPSFGGWNLDALFRDREFGLMPHRRIRRIAVVGDERWENWATGALYADLADEIRFFEREMRAQADDWLREPFSGATV